MNTGTERSSSDQLDGFVELNRTFLELPKQISQTDDEIELSQLFRIRDPLTWDHLIKNSRTVILSEAGAGKTQEIRHAALRLRADGKAAFFLRLELIPDDFDVAFEVGRVEEFNSWLMSANEGWLLLDSVDEARLRSPQDFERAIRKLGKLIANAKARVHIVLTGRTHAWRPKTDLDLCERHIGFPPELRMAAGEDSSQKVEIEPSLGVADTLETEERPDDKDPGFKIVTLEDLSRDQVASFALSKGASEVGEFLDEIERVDAWPSTARPQDLEEIVAIWIEQRRIGTRLEIMEHSIDRRLEERDQQRAEFRPVSKDRVREGAMLMAAAATVTHTQTIQVPDGAHTTKGLSPKSVLPAWTDTDIAALLSRPIFDNAIYGTVRFYHRSVREYLTAMWLAKLLQRPASRRAIESLLFKNQYGTEVVVPTMRPIFPWLAIFDPRILDRIQKVAPEVIFEGGDPSALPLPIRRAVLGDICHKIASGSIVDSATEYASVQRFAQPDIVSDVRALMARYDSNDGITRLLLRMIWLGRLKSLLPEAKKVALSPIASQYTRVAAFRAVRAIGNTVDQADIRAAFLNESSVLSREWIAELMDRLTPTTETIAWTLAAVEKSEPKEEFGVDHLVDALTSFTDAVNINDLPSLLSGIRRLLDQAPVIERGYCEVSNRFSWMMKPAIMGVERLIRARDQYALSCDSLEILRKFRALRELTGELRATNADLSSLVSDWPDLNDASFWHDVSATRTARRRSGKPVTEYWEAQLFGSFWQFREADFDRVCEWIQSRDGQDDRLVALTLSFAIFAANKKPRAWRERIKAACSSDAELEERFSELLNPPREHSEYRRQEQRWKRQSTARARKDAEQFDKDREYIKGNVELIRDPKLPDPADLSRLQWYLHERVREQDRSSLKWTDGRWRELIPIFGEEVARAYRDGAVAYWRRYRPLLRSDGAKANQTPAMVIFGLTGLAIEVAETAGWAKSLVHSDAALATRYALLELNGFPDWFPELFQVHKGVAAKIILREVEYELEADSSAESSHYVLSDTSWSGEWAWDELAPTLFEMISKREPGNISHLHQLLKIIQGSSIADSQIAQLARKKVKFGDHLADWFAVWVGVEPDAAVPALAQYLSELNEASPTFAMKFITKLWGGRRAETFGARNGFRTPRHLQALYFLMHEQIRTGDDIDRAGKGTYSPGLRDDAQEGRNRILKELNSISGKAAFVALQEIAAAESNMHARAHLEMLVRRKAEQDADFKPWTATNVREFNDRLDRTPSTHRELADLAVLRLLDLKDDLEQGDDSIAAVVRSISQETVLRNYIGHELRQKAFGRYAIPQEEELADAKRPDLRFHGLGIDAPVPAELKIADNWRGAALFERLENQLAGDYLRDSRSDRGIFLLVYRGEKRSRWKLPISHRSVDFDGLVEALREHWARIAPRFPRVEEITILAIDLNKRAG